MKTISFIKFSLCLLSVFSAYAQTTKTFKESFEVNKDVEVFLNVDDAEITIETWNKNRVDIEATFSIDIKEEDLANEILENTGFEALGNSRKVEISSATKSPRFMSNNIYYEENDNEILTEDVKGIAPPSPPLPPLPPSIKNIDLDFDMERFNEEGKAYIAEFQEEIKEMFKESNFKEEMQEWKEKFNEEIEKSGFKDSIRVMTYRLKEQMRPALREMREKLNEARSELQEERKILKGLRANRKVKKKIIIKIPRDAKLDLNVKRSQLKIASLNEIDANLNYSGLQIDELRGEACNITANYSDIDVTKAKALNLNLKYAKKVHIGEVNEFASVSKTSNLTIDRVNQKAVIEGSFGELTVNNISKDFTFIDINLKNSTAKLSLPDVVYNFYINSKSSEFDLASKLNYKVNEAFDSKIYQNKTASLSSKTLNIKADYSTVNLN
ncbi:hypothetical protein [Psychroflexus tropicus]|uniref:hypothetical protein n=1 Tax=Psychroflexus tropicus TaxID=197345 RepID=UPI00037C9946|nr:hypothetical protein [Psychroflexus tropicus]